MQLIIYIDNNNWNLFFLLTFTREKFIDLEFSYNKCQSMLRTMKTDANAEAAEKIRENQAMVDAILEKSQNEVMFT